MAEPDYDIAKNAFDIAVINDFLAKMQGSTTSAALTSYLDSNSASFINEIETTKDNNARLVFDGIGNAMTGQLNTYYYYQRNKDVNNLIDYPLKRMQSDADGMRFDNQNSQRQYEINQWTSGNRADTLFVYQIIFVLILGLAIFTGLWRTGFISTGLLSFLVFASIVVIVLVIVGRAQYTAFQRNKRYWNKRQFPRAGIAISGSMSCPAVTDMLSTLNPETLANQVRSGTAAVQGSVATSLAGAGRRLLQGADVVGGLNLS